MLKDKSNISRKFISVFVIEISNDRVVNGSGSNPAVRKMNLRSEKSTIWHLHKGTPDQRVVFVLSEAQFVLAMLLCQLLERLEVRPIMLSKNIRHNFHRETFVNRVRSRPKDRPVGIKESMILVSDRTYRYSRIHKFVKGATDHLVNE